MRNFADSFGVDKMRSGNAAVYQLKQQFENFSASPHKVDLCEGIASCFFQLEQYEDAANWYETAGRLILSQPTNSPAVNALLALPEYEKALDCHRRMGDQEKVAECSNMIRSLSRTCASN